VSYETTSQLTPAAAVARILAQQEWYTSARTVGCYLSMARGELRTNAIVADLLDKGS
jgi:5-formyltetrahydrofolate cyclo-ligase